MKIEKCRGKNCGASIFWAKTENAKWIPLDAKGDRRFIVVEEEQPGGDTHLVAKSVTTYMPHHATCPDVERFRL